MSVLDRVCIIEGFFLKKIYENFVGTLEDVRNGEVTVLERVRIIDVFLKKIYENFVGTLENVRNGEVTVLERSPYGEVRL